MFVTSTSSSEVWAETARSFEAVDRQRLTVEVNLCGTDSQFAQHVEITRLFDTDSDDQHSPSVSTT